MVDPPLYGFKVKLDHSYPERWSQYVKIRWHQLGHLIMLGIRYFFYWIYIKLQGRTPLMDYLNVKTGMQIYGVPLGGIGGGTIGRGFRGEFCRYQLKPGVCKYEVIGGNQFIVTIRDTGGKMVYQKVLSAAKKPKNLTSWDWSYKGGDASYVGLYPRSWTTYNIPEQKVILTCRQISPVIPNNYKDSCLPTGVFVWSVQNNDTVEKSISITFTFQNGIGDSSDGAAGCWSELFEADNSETSVEGLSIHHFVGDMPYTFTIGSPLNENVQISRLQQWNPLGSGQDVWNPLAENGCFPPTTKTSSPLTKKGQRLGVALCAQVNVSSGDCQNVELALAWDMPRVHFEQGARHYYKFYTREFGRVGDAGPKLICKALSSYKNWELGIDEWQTPVLSDPDLPAWYKSALFNESYYIADGGSVWFDIDEDELKSLAPDDPRRQYGRFAYLEGHEYRMYNTYDVHFYASFALALNWRMLQVVVQRDIADTVPQENSSKQWHLFEGDISERKKKNSIPHDVGDPGEEPFLKINSYPIHDVSEWRDLDLKYTLQCFRDYSINGDLNELRYHWGNIKTLMRGALRWDVDGDGLIENHGCPDQTFDTWIMTGSSAYCGSLWLAALASTVRMAELLEDPAQSEFTDLLSRAKIAFEKKLWNGKYYNFDCSRSRFNIIMTDQLCGLWYLLCCGMSNIIVPEENAHSAIMTVYNYNVKKFVNGKSGAVNGMTPNGEIDDFTVQSEEAWPGVIYAFSSLLLLHGKKDEAFSTAEGIYRTVYERIGMGFETPEGLYEKDCYRSIGYMRPLSIWSIQLAWEMAKQKQLVV